jgi:hypothetical protein
MKAPLPARDLRRLVAAVAAGAVVCLVIALAYGYANHQPQPREVRIAVAAPAAVRQQLVAGLHRAAEGGFAVLAATPASAVQSIKNQDAEGALVVSRGARPEIVTASAAGLTVRQAVLGVLGPVVAHLGYPARELDIAPLPPGDRAGQSSFVFELALLIPAVVGAVGLFLVGAHLRVWWRLLAAVVFAVVASALGVLVLNVVLGALTVAPLALLGFGAAGALACVMVVLALQAIFGLAGTGIAAFVFLFVGNAMSGGTIPWSFLPDGFRQISPWLPNMAIVRLTRGAVYFDSQGIGHPLLVLGIWGGCALAAISAVDVMHQAALNRTGGPAGDVYAASALSHLSRDKQTADDASRATATVPIA